MWVRGYGLVDSEKVRAEPGARLDLTAVPAPDAAAAAEYYPAQDWFALLEVPSPDEFPGTGMAGNGISPDIESQGEWIRSVVNTDGCTGCHALGNKATREIPDALGDFDSHFAAWDRRVQSGQAGATMDARWPWSGAIARWRCTPTGPTASRAGEYPLTAPARPSGVERNVVVTLWDWSDPEAYMHDLISADKRDPTVNANGPVYGAPENSTDDMPVVDPNTHVATVVPLQVRDADTPSSADHAAQDAVALLGRRSHLAQPQRRPQLRHGQPGARLDRRAGACGRDPGLLPAGFEPPVRAGVPHRAEQPPRSRCTTPGRGR